MSDIDLDSLDQRLQVGFALASSHLWRRHVKVRHGQDRGATGVVQAVTLGARGEIVATVRIKHDQPLSHPRRLRLKLADIIIGDEIDDVQPGTRRGAYRKRGRR